MSYTVRCRDSTCRHRRTMRKHPDEYVRMPKCEACGSLKGWRIEPMNYASRPQCDCGGPIARGGGSYPHTPDHPLCDQHPEGFYNQAKARGVADEDIPAEHLPVRFKDHADCPF